MAVSGRIRLFAYAYLAVVLVAALAVLEYWPLTGFRLYHQLRRPTHPSWELATVDGAGVERGVSLFDLPVAYRNTERQLGRDRVVDPLRADEVCRAWADAFRARDDDAEMLRIYRIRLDARSGERLTRQLIHSC